MSKLDKLFADDILKFRQLFEDIGEKPIKTKDITTVRYIAEEKQSIQTELIDFSNMSDAEYDGFTDAWSRSYSSYYDDEKQEEYDRGYDLCVSKGWEHVGSDFEYAHHKEI